MNRRFRSAHSQVAGAAVSAAVLAALAAAMVGFGSALSLSGDTVKIIALVLSGLAAVAALAATVLVTSTGRRLAVQVLVPLDEMTAHLRRLLIAGVGRNLDALPPSSAPELREIWDAYSKLVLALERARAHAQVAIDATASRNRTALDAAMQAEQEKAKGETDPLTQLFNRRRMDADIARDCMAVEVNGASFAFVMVDVDHFKMANDTWGHQKGDEILQMLAGILHASIRDHDAAYRYGGEEFSLLLRNINADAVFNVVDRIRNRVADTFGRTGTPVTASFGVSMAPRHGSTPAEVIGAADGALYEAKEGGRNRTVLAQTEDEPVASSTAEPETAGQPPG